jgi:hypothetical protein
MSPKIQKEIVYKIHLRNVSKNTKGNSLQNTLKKCLQKYKSK